MSNNYQKSVSNFAETIEQISLMKLKEPTEDNLAAGDGCQIKSQSVDEKVKSNLKAKPINSMGDHADFLEAKASNTSTFSTLELEQLFKFRLQKLAEYENAQSELVEGSGANGDKIQGKAQTWQEFWKSEQQESSEQ